MTYAKLYRPRMITKTKGKTSKPETTWTERPGFTDSCFLGASCALSPWQMPEFCLWKMLSSEWVQKCSHKSVYMSELRSSPPQVFPFWCCCLFKSPSSIKRLLRAPLSMTVYMEEYMTLNLFGLHCRNIRCGHLCTWTRCKPCTNLFTIHIFFKKFIIYFIQLKFFPELGRWLSG